MNGSVRLIHIDPEHALYTPFCRILYGAGIKYHCCNTTTATVYIRVCEAEYLFHFSVVLLIHYTFANTVGLACVQHL